MIGSKPISRISTFAVLVSVMTGCTSTRRYFLDRKQDVADIFTLCGGVGCGGQVRVGRIPLGAVAEADLVGLRYGELFCRTEVPNEPEEINTPLLNVAALGLAGMGAGVAAGIGGAPMPVKSLSNGVYWAVKGGCPISKRQMRRGKGRYSPSSPEWFTLEVVGGFGLMGRAGFNAAELLDFVVGWTTIDVLGDDWKGQERRRIQLATSDKPVGMEGGFEFTTGERHSSRRGTCPLDRRVEPMYAVPGYRTPRSPRRVLAGTRNFPSFTASRYRR